MSAHDQAAAAVLSQVALAADGAFLGLAIAYVAVRSIIKFRSTSAALGKICHAPSVQVSDLRSIASLSDGSDREDILIVRGVVESKSAVDGIWKSLRPNILVSQESYEDWVISQRTQTCIYNVWRGFFGWTSDLRSLFARSWKEQESSSIRMFIGKRKELHRGLPKEGLKILFGSVPFVLVESGWQPKSDYVIVNMDRSKHPLPLVTVFHQLQPISASPYTFLQALFGHEYPIALLDEKKILPLGKEITAVGYVSLKDGIAEIRSCKDLPYFLSDMIKDEMVADLGFKVKVLLWSGVILGSFAIGTIGYAAVRNWVRWKEWRQHRRAQRRAQEQNRDEATEEEEVELDDGDDMEDIPDGQLCVVCLTRRKKYAFEPCGHLVCCRRCAFSVTRYLSPKCPLCRQNVNRCLRIYSD